MEAIMRRALFAIIAIGAVALLAMTTPPAFARGHGGGHGKWGGYSAFAKAPSGGSFRHHNRWSEHRWSRHRWDKHRWSRRNRDWRPPGWDRGKKTGWGDGDRPPGLSGTTRTQDGSGEQRASDTLGQASDTLRGFVERFQR